MSRLILDVLIPTYQRPQAAIRAIDSVLSGADPRARVFCHSNGKEPELEFAAEARPSVRYGNFIINRGGRANFRKLIDETKADYLLFLSDEDQVNPKYLNRFIDYLEYNQCGFVLCSVVSESGSNYFSLDALQGEVLSADDMLVLFPTDPTYISGYCFQRALLNDSFLNTAFEDHPANVYPHLILRNLILPHTRVGLFTPGIIIKGSEAKIGGDSHAHLKQKVDSSESTTERKLNPQIYSEGARVDQFFYLTSKMINVLASMNWLKEIYANIYILTSWLKITSEASMYADSRDEDPKLADIVKKLPKEYYNEKIYFHRLYRLILSIRISWLKKAIIFFLWKITKAVKLILFFRRFGIHKTFTFVRGRHTSDD